MKPLLVFVSLLVLSTNLARAVGIGPTIPTHAKYSPCSVTGIVIENYVQPINHPNCPIGYEENTSKIFVNQSTGSIAVVFPESFTSSAERLICVQVEGVLLPPCYGGERPICVVSTVTEVSSCSDFEL